MMLRCRRRRALRTAGSVLSMAPNSRSKTTRGFASTGSGVVGLAHARRFWYAQLKPTSHVPTPLTVSVPSRPSSRDGSGVSWPIAFAAI